MSIGIIGAGALGSNLARMFAKVGISAVISNSRGPETLSKLVDELGPTIKAATTEEAAKADIVFVAIRWVDLKRVLGALPAWNGRIVVDGTNPVEWIEPDSPDANDPSNPLAAYGIKPVDLGGRHSSSVVRDLVPGARLVKAFNHLDVNFLAQPEVAGGNRVLYYSGDDAEAKVSIRSLIEKSGFFAVDLGTLDVGGPLASLPFGPLAGVSFVKV
ncbi:NAD binding domain of 6-phosphogluconate dehydrogenase family protein [Burkholderia cenocepacia]|uniref:NAD binding domain of 6-phosphogluconate dehydrogenase family protein n=1 Tax=Burkholderia cenocepacia TaxID=95486 RepID=A0AAN0RWJ4_9BURK|nr:NAD binding domain of 6-phosphogluconate dehydrogenase family protein [Burkholderia cenocepacia]